MDQEPHGEERDDLRIGALASVIWNCNLDTKAMGGPLKPFSYITGWNGERVSVFTLKPKGLEEKGQGQVESGGDIGSNKLNLSDPIGWENFTTGLERYNRIVNG